MAKPRPVLALHSLLGGMQQIRVLIGDKPYDFVIPNSSEVEKIIYGKFFGWKQFKRLQELSDVAQDQ